MAIQWGNQIQPNIAGSIQQGYAFGTQMKQQQQAQQDQNALRKLAPGVIGGDINALSQAAAIDPAAAGKYDAVGVDIAKRAAGAASYMMDAVKRGNPQEIEGRYQAVRPFLEKLGAAQGKVPPPTFDPASIPAMEQIIARSQGMGGGKEDMVQSTRIGADGFYYTVDRSGNWTNSGIKADPRTQLRDAPGVAPGIVDLRTGAVSGLQAGGAPAPAPVAPPAMAPGEVPFAIDPTLPANVQADIRARQPMYAAASEGNGVVPPGPAPAAVGGGNQIQTTQAVGDGPAAMRPSVSPVEAERLRLAQEANDRAAASANKPSALQEKLDLARQMGATPEQLQAMVVGNASTKGPSAAEQKDMLARRAKVPQLQNAVRGLSRIETALANLNLPGINTGPLDQHVVRQLPAGQELEAAVGGIQNSFLSLTRVPGIGSQSDLEARIAALQYPSLDKAPEVNARTMENLKAFARDLAQAYQSAIESDATTPPPEAQSAPATRGPQPGTIEAGYRFRGGDPADPSSWERV